MCSNLCSSADSLQPPDLIVRRPYARNATATPKGRITESTLFQLPEHIYGSVDSCIPTALHPPPLYNINRDLPISSYSQGVTIHTTPGDFTLQLATYGDSW